MRQDEVERLLRTLFGAVQKKMSRAGCGSSWFEWEEARSWGQERMHHMGFPRHMTRPTRGEVRSADFLGACRWSGLYEHLSRMAWRCYLTRGGRRTTAFRSERGAVVVVGKEKRVVALPELGVAMLDAIRGGDRVARCGLLDYLEEYEG